MSVASLSNTVSVGLPCIPRFGGGLTLHIYNLIPGIHCYNFLWQARSTVWWVGAWSVVPISVFYVYTCVSGTDITYMWLSIEKVGMQLVVSFLLKLPGPICTFFFNPHFYHWRQELASYKLGSSSFSQIPSAFHAFLTRIALFTFNDSPLRLGDSHV